MSLKQYFATAADQAKDLPQIAATGLVLWGLNIESWIVILTAAWALVRLVTAGMEFYWKWKDRRNGNQSRD